MREFFVASRIPNSAGWKVYTMHASIALVALRFLVAHAQLPTADRYVPSVEELCPYSRFCTKGPSKTLNIEGHRPCCLPCSCSDRCSLTGNCCPDKTLQGTAEKATKEPCRDQHSIYRKLLNDTFSTSSLSYRIIDTCPWERSGNVDWNETATECYREITDISDLMFVSDAETYDVFINKHCAKCNGVRDIIYWHLQMKCPPHEFINLTSLHERDELIRTGRCSVSSRPPSTDIGMHSVCFNWATNTCNNSRNWKVYDREIERRCNSHNQVYVYFGDGHAYTNVYCYLCNIPSKYDMREMCPAIEFTDNRGLIVKFTAIIIQTDDSSKANARAMECKETEVMDPFLAACTDLICPITYIPHEGACQALAEEYEGLFVEAHLDLGPANLTSSASVRNLHYYNIINGVKNMLKPVEAARCDICHVTVADQNNGERVAKVMFQPTDFCGTMKLTHMIEKVFQKEPKEIKLPDGMVTVYAYLRKEKVDDDKSLYATSPDKCGYSVFYNPDSITCPSIVYQLPRLRETIISNKTITKIPRKSKQLSDFEFRICLDAYLRIFKEVSAGKASLKGMFEGILVAVIISLLIYR